MLHALFFRGDQVLEGGPAASLICAGYHVRILNMSDLVQCEGFS